MVLNSKTTSLALFAFGLASRQVMAATTCTELITEIGAASGPTTTPIKIDADLTCNTHIEITHSQDVTISGPYTISIAAGFTSAAGQGGSSLFVNEGTLTLEGLTFDTKAASGNRAVWNKGTLTVTDCILDLFPGGDAEAFVDEGGAIYSDSSESVTISGSTFKSNIAKEKGGAMCVLGSEILTVRNSGFTQSEAGQVGSSTVSIGQGGDIYAGPNVDLTVTATTFSGSSAETGGASILCCGATIQRSNFTGAESASPERHFGAVQVGAPGDPPCSRPLTISDSLFSGCTVGAATGEGGALSAFDTTVTIRDSIFEGSEGTALFFESSSAAGDYKLEMDYVQFNENSRPSDKYSSTAGSPQGAAVVVTNTQAGGGEVETGTTRNMYCFGNDPYECEFVYDGATLNHDGEFKCQLCNIDGVRQATGADDEFGGVTDRSIDSGGSGSNTGIVVGLSLALGLTLVVIGALAAWKIRVRKNARRLMEDMGEGDL